MYNEIKNIENDLETLLIRLSNLERQLKKYDNQYITYLLHNDIYISEEEVRRVLNIESRTLDELFKLNFFKKKKEKYTGCFVYLLLDVCWLITNLKKINKLSAVEIKQLKKKSINNNNV